MEEEIDLNEEGDEEKEAVINGTEKEDVGGAGADSIEGRAAK